MIGNLRKSLDATGSQSNPAPVARLADVSLRYGRTHALDAVRLDLPAGCMVGLIGPAECASRAWGTRVTTVFPRLGHYAHDPKVLTAYPRC
jgi:hypothetical protein